ncbi:MAG: hypothetical protein QHG99_03575 [Methanomicrobiales archaeon]|nr:hypothetical protein [Methanomicrobiales archaeon]
MVMRKQSCGMERRCITGVPELVRSLPSEERALFDRMFRVTRRSGRLILPGGMEKGRRIISHAPQGWQQIVRITNLVTGESTLFNEERARRPFETRSDAGVRASIEETRGDAFCHPEESTPLDLFGRVRGRHALTASNMAKYDHLHGVIIFDEHDPLVWEEGRIEDYLNVGMGWFMKAREQDPEARYPLFLWNCLWRAGASIVHGHAQVLLSVEPYSAVESLEKVRSSYNMKFGHEYETDLIDAHRALGLAMKRKNVEILAYLTPVKEKEAMILSRDYSSLAGAIAYVLHAYRDLGVQSFNLAILMPPLGEEGIFTVRLVDRGEPGIRSSDIGAMELYARTSVVAGDPFRLMEALKV